MLNRILTVVMLSLFSGSAIAQAGTFEPTRESLDPAAPKAPASVSRGVRTEPSPAAGRHGACHREHRHTAGSEYRRMCRCLGYGRERLLRAGWRF